MKRVECRACRGAGMVGNQWRITTCEPCGGTGQVTVPAGYVRPVFFESTTTKSSPVGVECLNCGVPDLTPPDLGHALAWAHEHARDNPKHRPRVTRSTSVVTTFEVNPL